MLPKSIWQYPQPAKYILDYLQNLYDFMDYM